MEAIQQYVHTESLPPPILSEGLVVGDHDRVPVVRVYGAFVVRALIPPSIMHGPTLMPRHSHHMSYLNIDTFIEEKTQYAARFG